MRIHDHASPPISWMRQATASQPSRNGQTKEELWCTVHKSARVAARAQPQPVGARRAEERTTALGCSAVPGRPGRGDQVIGLGRQLFPESPRPACLLRRARWDEYDGDAELLPRQRMGWVWSSGGGNVGVTSLLRGGGGGPCAETYVRDVCPDRLIGSPPSVSPARWWLRCWRCSADAPYRRGPDARLPHLFLWRKRRQGPFVSTRSSPRGTIFARCLGAFRSGTPAPPCQACRCNIFPACTCRLQPYRTTAIGSRGSFMRGHRHQPATGSYEHFLFRSLLNHGCAS
ncbi:hypothetical protein BS78_09G141500 [Paspalum vaginatum]|nr:hypothetical protein BS78_09G141500 [Paspalum vaginatum]KAJ1262866.1 hypothetical protein BS78_09G141500 [Paspalum vaginatum]